MVILDLAVAFWIVMVFGILFVWLPVTRSFSSPTGRPLSTRAAGQFARMALVTVLAVSILSPLRLLNWLTLAIVYASWPACLWVSRHRFAAVPALRTAVRQMSLNAAILWERGAPREHVMAKVAMRAGQYRDRLAGRVSGVRLLSTGVLPIGLLVFIGAMMTLLLRFSSVLGQSRLAHPDEYEVLLTTQQLLAGQPTGIWVPAYPALAATLSLFSSAAPVYVVRLLGPVLGCLLVVAVVWSVRRVTGNIAAALAAGFSLGLYVFTPPEAFAQSSLLWLSELSRALNEALTRQWAGGTAELGALFLLLSVVFWHEVGVNKRTGAVVDAVVCIALIALTAPALLFVQGFVVGLAFFPRMPVMLLTGVSWLLIAVASTTVTGLRALDLSVLATLPAGLSLLCGGLFHLVGGLLRSVSRARLEPALATVLAVVALALMPHNAGGHYLEYDVAARKTLEIVDRFPRQRWLIVAPVEQLAHTYGRGWHEDLQQFVDEYSGRVDQPGFRFPFLVNDLFVFVEKHPFVTFASEAVHVPFSVLTDPTYRHYRSLAGRSSLQFAAHDLCERYRRHHPGASIYFEDDALRIYRFALP